MFCSNSRTAHYVRPCASDVTSPGIAFFGFRDGLPKIVYLTKLNGTVPLLALPPNWLEPDLARLGGQTTSKEEWIRVRS